MQVPHRELRARAQLAVGLHVRRAAGGVHDDDVGAGERVPGARREATRHAEPPVVRSERAAARLGPRHLARASRCRSARGSWRGSPGGTSGPARTPSSRATVPRASTSGRRLARARAVVRRAGRSRQELPRARRQERPGDRLQRGGGPDERRVGEHPVEPQPADEPRPARPLRLDLFARGLHHPAERHVRRADVLARAAHQAQVHEPLEGRVRRRDAVLHGAHRRDPPARRRRLLAGQPVGRAVRQAEPARDAAVEVASRSARPGRAAIRARSRSGRR